jgi:hypothetical protein
MDSNTATELAYKNGYVAGMQSAEAEVNARVKIAYEQLSLAHTAMCRYNPHRQNTKLLSDIQDGMDMLLKLQVKLGIIKHDEY